MVKTIVIRQANKHDAACLAELAGRVFRGTYGANLSLETLTAHLETQLSSAVFEQEILEPQILFWLAEQQGKPFGFIKLKPNLVPDCVGSSAAIELVKLYVDSGHQQSGIGFGLLETALKAVAQDFEAVWLLVWEENLAAIAFYQKHGFKVLGRQDVWVGKTIFHDLVMSRRTP